jgi:ankyrin repeat protein
MLAAMFFAAMFVSAACWAGALHDATETGNLARIKQLVSAGADVNEIDNRGIWPLLAAVTDGNLEAIKLLLALHANPNQADHYQYSALHEAANLGYPAALELLIDANADINARDINGITPLGYALRSSSAEAVALLQRMGGIQ